MSDSNIAYYTVKELSKKIESKEISPVEVTQSYLDRIETLNKKLNSYITVSREEALDAARRAEREIISGQYRGPLHGIPVAVKDQLLTKDIQTTAGSEILRGWIPKRDATCIVKLKDAGAVVIGKTNMTEYAITTNHNFPYGIPLNPWDPTRYSGSSSGGSAAATAAFLCATSLGEDTGGSVRGPASLCGLAGLRPTWGLVSRHGLLAASWSMDIVGPISRTVEDCAMTLQAISGYDPLDPYTWKIAVPDYMSSLNGDIRDVKIGIVKERLHTDDVDIEVRTTVEAAVDVLNQLSEFVEEISVPDIVHCATYSMTIGLVEGAAVHRDIIRNHSHMYQRELRLVNLVGSLIPAQTYYKAQQLRGVWREQLLKVLESYDVLVYPTSPSTAPKVPPPTGLQNRADAKADLYGRRSFTHPVNLAGCPALSVNCGFNSEGLPVGLQIIGRPGEDSTVLNVGYAYQEATDWHKRRPVIS